MALRYKMSALIQLVVVLFSSISSAQRYDGQYWPCNPTVNATGLCMPNPGLTTSKYFIDFTKQTLLPADWAISDYATVPFGANGAEFTFAKRNDAPQLFTRFYIFFGRVETVMRVAPGRGIISSDVLMSDDFDEIDWEFSGNNFNLSTTGMGQNNYFGKGVTGNHDRGQFFEVPVPQSQFHTYTTDWTPDQITWSIDGAVTRTLRASDCAAKGYAYQSPQTPSKFQLGMWDGGDPDANWGTVSWAGGYTDLEAGPYTMYVKSVSIRNANPVKYYNWTDQSGSWQSIQLINDPVLPISLSSSKSSALSTIPVSASSSVVSRIPSSLSSLGAQFAGTSATPSITASIATKSATSLSTSTSAISTATSAYLTFISTTSKSITSSSSPAPPAPTPLVKATTATKTTQKPTYTPHWHYWRNRGHWVRGWW